MTWEGPVAAGQTNGGVGGQRVEGLHFVGTRPKDPLFWLGRVRSLHRQARVGHMHILLHGPVPVAVLSLLMARYIESVLIHSLIKHASTTL